MLQEPCLQNIFLVKLRRARLCEKTAFQALKKVFFRAALLKLRQARPCKKTNQALKKSFFFFSALLLWSSDKPGFANKNNFSGSKKLLFPRCSYETQTSPALQTKTTFQALKNYFFRAALMKLRQARLCKKTTTFLRMSLVKSANCTSLPRFSSLQNAQMHTIHNEECSKNLRDPRPIVVEICLHSNRRIWGTLGLKLSDFWPTLGLYW